MVWMDFYSLEQKSATNSAGHDNRYATLILTFELYDRMHGFYAPTTMVYGNDQSLHCREFRNESITK